MKFVLLLILLISLNINADESRKKIVWYAYDQPPAYIVSGEFANKGFINQALKLLTEAMPNYHHSYEHHSLDRVINALKTDRKVCFFGLFSTEERREFAYFSDYSLMHNNLQVLIPLKTAKRLSLANSVDVSALFNEYKLTVGIIGKRSYGDFIDTILKQHKNLTFIRTSSSTKHLFKMLDHGRFDFMISYPSAINFAMTSILLNQEYTFLTIEGVPDFISGHIACSKTDWGKRIITEINEVLPKVKNTTEYLEALSYWIKNNDNFEAYKAYYYNDFLKPPVN